MVCFACFNFVIWYLSYEGPQESVKGVRHWKTSLEDKKERERNSERERKRKREIQIVLFIFKFELILSNVPLF